MTTECRKTRKINKTQRMMMWFYAALMFLVLLTMFFGAAVGFMIARATTPVEYVEIEMPVYIEKTVQSEERNPEAEDVARVLYGICDYQLSDKAKAAVVEVIMNRAACSYGEFGDSIIEVCQKPNQWQGFTTGGSYLESDYELAQSILNDTSGAKTIPGNCYYLCVEKGQVTVRQEWDSPNKWVVK